MFQCSKLVLLLLALCSVAQAAETPILRVYTYSSFVSEWGPGPKLKSLFETRCNCTVQYRSFGDGVTILNRLKLEGARSQADVIIGLDTNLISAAKASAVVQPHNIAPFPHRQLDWWDADFVPYDYGYFAFIYNKQRISQPPTSLHELLSADNHWKIVYQDPRTSTPGLGLLLWMQAVYGDDSANAWQQLAKKTLTVTSGWSEAYGLMLKNEADFVLSYDTSPAVHLMNDNDDRYAAAAFSEGHYRQIEVAAIGKYSRQVALAQQFLHFLSEPEAQQLFAKHNIMRPVIDVPLPEAFSQLIPVDTVLSLPPEEVAAHRQDWIATWLRAVSR